MKERKRFLLYYDWENLIQDMSDEDIASLTRCIFKYQNTWEVSDMKYWAKLAFSFMRPVFDEDRKDWEEIKKKNSDNIKKRWDKYKTIQSDTTVYDRIPNDTYIDSVIVNDIDSVNEIKKTDTKEVIDFSGEIEKIVNVWNSELWRNYEVTGDLLEVYKRVRKKERKETMENVTMDYIDKCRTMDKKYHLSPFKFYKQPNWFITIKNSIC